MPAGDQHRLGHAGPDERLDRVGDHRPVVDRQQVLVRDAGQRVETAAGPAGQDHALHGLNASSSTFTMVFGALRRPKAAGGPRNDIRSVGTERSRLRCVCCASEPWSTVRQGRCVWLGKRSFGLRMIDLVNTFRRGTGGGEYPQNESDDNDRVPDSEEPGTTPAATTVRSSRTGSVHRTRRYSDEGSGRMRRHAQRIRQFRW